MAATMCPIGFHLFGGPVITYADHLSDGTYNIIIETSAPANPPNARPGIILAIKNVTGTGVYTFNDPNSQYAEYSLYPTNGIADTPKIYNEYKPGHGALTLTRFDTKNNIIAGTFWFNASNVSNPADSAKITNGHFDITSYTAR